MAVYELLLARSVYKNTFLAKYVLLLARSAYKNTLLAIYDACTSIKGY